MDAFHNALLLFLRFLLTVPDISENYNYNDGAFHDKMVYHPGGSSALPDISLTTDIIVGFPGETEEDFEETLDVVSKCGYDTAFTFLYSRRSGTPAAEMEQIPQDVAKERFNRLLALVQQEGRIRSSRFEGSVQEVLVEGIFTGRTEYNLLVHFPGTADLLGKYVKVSLDECHGFYYMGSLVEE